MKLPAVSTTAVAAVKLDTQARSRSMIDVISYQRERSHGVVRHAIARSALARIAECNLRPHDSV